MIAPQTGKLRCKIPVVKTAMTFDVELGWLAYVSRADPLFLKKLHVYADRMIRQTNLDAPKRS